PWTPQTAQALASASFAAERFFRRAVAALDATAHEAGKIGARVFAGEEQPAFEFGCGAVFAQTGDLADERARVGAEHEFLRRPVHHDLLAEAGGFRAGED